MQLYVHTYTLITVGGLTSLIIYSKIFDHVKSESSQQNSNRNLMNITNIQAATGVWNKKQ